MTVRSFEQGMRYLIDRQGVVHEEAPARHQDELARNPRIDMRTPPTVLSQLFQWIVGGR